MVSPWGCKAIPNHETDHPVPPVLHLGMFCRYLLLDFDFIFFRRCWPVDFIALSFVHTRKGTGCQPERWVWWHLLEFVADQHFSTQQQKKYFGFVLTWNARLTRLGDESVFSTWSHSQVADQCLFPRFSEGFKRKPKIITRLQDFFFSLGVKVLWTSACLISRRAVLVDNVKFFVITTIAYKSFTHTS